MSVFTVDKPPYCGERYNYSPFGTFGFEAFIYRWNPDPTWRVIVSREENDPHLDCFFQSFYDASLFAIYHVNNFNKRGMFPHNNTDIEIDINSCVCPTNRLNVEDYSICLGCGRSFPSWGDCEKGKLPCGCSSSSVFVLEEDMLPKDRGALKSIILWLAGKLNNDQE